MAKEEALELIGVVTETNKDTFRVECGPDNNTSLKNKIRVSTRLGGPLRKNFIKVVTGDKVKIEVSPYDLEKGRIIYRFK